MKFKNIFLVLLSSLSLSAFAQDSVSISQDVDKYFTSLENNDFETFLDYLYPEFFKIMPRNTLKEQLVSSMKGDETMKMSLKNNKVTAIGATKVVKENKYTIVDYSFMMVYQFAQSDEDSGGESDEESSVEDFTYESLKLAYGEQNVIFDRVSNKIEVKVSNQMMAIFENGFDTWKFIGYDENIKPALKKILPKELFEE